MTRPTTISGIVGQVKVKERLRIMLDSAAIRGEPLGHVLASGPPGLGKTTFALAIANELSTNIEITNGAGLRSIKDIAPYIMRVNEGSILFVDEVHRTTKIVQEYLYTVLEDFYCVIGKGELSKRIKVPQFTVIAATTHAGKLSQPFRDRFKHELILSLYNNDELLELAKKTCGQLHLLHEEDALLNVVKRSRGTPRILNKYLEWCRDFVICENEDILTSQLVDKAMLVVEVDKNGLTKDDRKYLTYLKKADRPMGVKAISSGINIPPETIEDVIEPFLVSKGFIIKTSSGRILR